MRSKNFTAISSTLIVIFFNTTALARICSKGKACGNTCIAAWKTCHVGPGTAIDEVELKEKEIPQESAAAEPLESKIDTNVEKKFFRFRSQGAGYFLVQDSDQKTYKCTSYCRDMTYLKKGAKVQFLNNMQIVEFQTNIKSVACETNGCTEVGQ